MAKAKAKQNPKKRQPTKRKLPSLPVKKKVVRKRKQPNRIKKIQLRVGRNTTLQITFQLSTLPARKSKKPVTKKARNKAKSSLRNPLVRIRQAALTLLMIGIGITGLAYCVITVLNPPALQTPYYAAAAIPVEPNAINHSLPASDATKLEIPAIGLSARVELVGRHSDGTIEVPPDVTVAGQYRFAPTPGELGPAIIVGHVDTYKGPAVFWYLRDLKPGQIIKVSRVDGKTAKFKINKIKDFPQNDFPTQDVYGDIDYAGLRLITCGGTFNYLSNRYSNNTVVFASLVR
jgi:hypothetical protein